MTCQGRGCLGQGRKNLVTTRELKHTVFINSLRQQELIQNYPPFPQKLCFLIESPSVLKQRNFFSLSFQFNWIEKTQRQKTLIGLFYQSHLQSPPPPRMCNCKNKLIVRLNSFIGLNRFPPCSLVPVVATNLFFFFFFFFLYFI